VSKCHGVADTTSARQMCEEIEKARSLDRIEIFLTPRYTIRYTVQRLASHLHMTLPFGPRIPAVRLYSPATVPRRAGDRAAISPLCGVGMNEILVEPDITSLTLPIGIKLRHLENGTYVAKLVCGDSPGTDQVLFEVGFTATEPEAEWLLPAHDLRVSAPANIRVLVTRKHAAGLETVYESLPLRIRHVERERRHHYVLGRRGSRLLDLAFAVGAALLLVVPFGALAWYVRRRIAMDFPDIAAERARQFRSPLLRYLAPAFYRDPSRWVYAEGELRPGTVFKLETLTPGKRPLAGPVSLLFRQLGIDEWPQLLLLLSGEWSLFGPRAFPNRDGLLAPDGRTLQDSRDIRERYLVGNEVRKPGALSMRVAITPRGSIGVPPWPTALLYDYYDSLHWSLPYAARLLGRLALSFIWGEAVVEHISPVDMRVPSTQTVVAPAAVASPSSS